MIVQVLAQASNGTSGGLTVGGFVFAAVCRGIYGATPAGQRAALKKRQAAANKAAYKEWKAEQKRARG